MTEIIMSGRNELNELLDKEINDYGFSHTVEDVSKEYCDNEYEVYDVHIKQDCSTIDRTLRFRYLDEALEVELGEDSWQEVEWWKPSVRYLWQALLKWA